MSELARMMAVMEWRQTFRRGRLAVFALLTLDLVVAVALGFAPHGAARLAVARTLFETMAGAQFCLIAMIGPALGSAAIVEERTQHTAGLLALTGLSGWDVVLAKFASRAALVLVLLAASAPLPALPLWLGASAGAQLARLLLVTAVAGLSGTAIGLVVAMRVPRASQATILSFFTLLLLFVILPSAARLAWSLQVAVAAASPWLDAWSPLFAFHDELIGTAPAAGWSRCGWSAGTGLVLTAAMIVVGARSWTLDRLRAWEAAEQRPDRAPAADSARSTPNRSRQRLAPAARFSPAAAAAFFLVMFVGIVLVQRPHMTWEDLALGMSGVYFPVSWFLLDLAMVLYAARAFAVEKEDGTLEVLASTPLSNAALIWNKLAQLFRLAGWVPATLAGCQLALWAAAGDVDVTDAPSVMMLAGTPLAVATRVVHFYLVIIGALWLSGWSRNVTRAMLATLVAFLGLLWVGSAVSDWILGLGGLRAGLGTGHGAALGTGLALAGIGGRVAAAAALHAWLNRRLRVFAARH